MNAPLRINKCTVEVELRNARGEERHAQIFIAEEIPAEGRAERLQDVFQNRRFVPVRVDGKVDLVSARHVLWFRASLFEALDDLDPQAEQDGESVLVHVHVRMIDGSSLDGDFRYWMPSGQRRLVDYLDALPGWVPLRTADWLYLLNREHILSVIQTSSN